MARRRLSVMIPDLARITGARRPHATNMPTVQTLLKRLSPPFSGVPSVGTWMKLSSSNPTIPLFNDAPLPQSLFHTLYSVLTDSWATTHSRFYTLYHSDNKYAEKGLTLSSGLYRMINFMASANYSVAKHPHVWLKFSSNWVSTSVEPSGSVSSLFYYSVVVF